MTNPNKYNIPLYRLILQWINRLTGYIGPFGEIQVEPEKWRLIGHDAVTPGGVPFKTDVNDVLRIAKVAVTNNYNDLTGKPSAGLVYKAGSQTGFTDRTISILFSTENQFQNIPVGRSNTYVYREFVNEEGQPTDMGVEWYNQVVTQLGFSLQLAEGEDPDGVIVEYLFTEIT